MSDEILKKPIHYVLLKDTLLERLRREGRLQGEHAAATTPPDRSVLPGPQKQASSPLSSMRMRTPAHSTNIARQSVLRTQLKVIYDRVPPIAPEKAPPCDTCKTAACCRAFIVGIEKPEYDSGLYGDYAIEMTAEMRKQLRANSNLMQFAMNAPSLFDNNSSEEYFLEGTIGTACPFLQPDMRCGIYNHRPLTCRTYTCVGDERITQDMRDGKVDIGDAMRGGPKTVKGK